MFLEISPNSHGNTSARVSFLTKLPKACRTPFLTEYFWWLLLSVQHCYNKKSNFDLTTEAVVTRCSIEKVPLEICQNSQENTCARVSFWTKLQASFIKKRLWRRCFLVNFVQFLRTPFFTENLRWLLL